VGKIKSKYLIIEILSFSIDDFFVLCKYLYSCSRQMRNLLIKNYSLLKNMLLDTHMFESTLELTKDYKTSEAAH
jgi:hypothetical protein